MARLAIGVDVTGAKEVEKLRTSVMGLEAAVNNWVSSSGKAAGATSGLVANLVLAGKEAAKTSSKIDTFFQSRKSTLAAEVLAQAKAVDVLQESYDSLIRTMAKQHTMGSVGSNRIAAVDDAIKANMKAYEKLKSQGVVSGTYDRNADYSYELTSRKQIAEISEKMVANEAKRAAMQKKNEVEVLAALKAEEKARQEVALATIKQFEAQQKVEASNAKSRIPVVSDYSQQGRDRLAAGSKAGGYDYAKQIAAEASLFEDVSGKVKVHTGILGKLGDAWDNAGKKASIFHNILRGGSGAAGALWMTYGQMIPMIAGFATVASTMKTVTAGSDFDYMARSIQKLSGEAYAGTEALTAIKGGLLGINGLASTPHELAQGMLEFARAGIPAAQAMKDIEEASKFSFLGEMDMSKVVELSVGLMSAFKGTTASSALNEIAIVADKTSVSLGQMSEAFKNTTSLGTVMGLDFKDIAVSLGVLGQAGVRGASAGAALTTMMYKLAAPTSSAAKKMKEFGVSFDVFDNITGKIKPITQIAEEMSNLTKTLNPKQTSELFESMVGIRGVKALGALVDMAKDGSKQFAELKRAVDSVGNSAGGTSYLSKYFETVSESGKVQIKILQADLDKLFTANYDNSSVVNAVKELDKAINQPATAQMLAQITSSTINLVTSIAQILNSMPELVEYGLLGYLLLGKKGAVLGATISAIESYATRVSAFVANIASESKKTERDFQGMFNPLKTGGDLIDAVGSIFSGTAIKIESGADSASNGLKKLSAGFSMIGASDKVDSMSRVASFLDTLEMQISEVNKRKIDIIQDEKLTKLGEFKTLLSGAGLTQKDFNEQLDIGTKLIDQLYDTKIAENLKKDLSSASGEWEAYSQQAIASNDTILRSAMQSAASALSVTSKTIAEIVNQTKIGAEQAAKAAMDSAKKNSDNVVVGLFKGLQAEYSAYKGGVLNAFGGQTSDQADLEKIMAMALQRNAEYRAKGSYDLMPKSKQLATDQKSALVVETERIASASKVLKEYMLDHDTAMKELAKPTGKAYLGTAFDADKVKAAPDWVKSSIETLSKDTKDSLSQKFTPGINKALEAENRKTAASDRRAEAEANKEASKAMRQLLASYDLYIEKMKDTKESAKEWNSDAKALIGDIDSFVKTNATVGMTKIDAEVYKHNEAMVEAGKAQVEYDRIIGQSSEKLGRLGAEYGQSMQKMQQIRAELSANRLGLTEDQVNDKTKDIINQQQDLVKQYDLVKKAQDELIGKSGKLQEVTARLQATISNTSPWDAMGKAISDLSYTTEEKFNDVYKATQHVFSSMEDALVSFVTTGKMSFTDLANSIMADIAKIAVKQAVISPLMGLLGAGSSASGSWTNPDTGFAFGGFLDTVSSWFSFHTGGVVGSDYNSLGRPIDPSVFQGASRFHSGLLPNEFPAILQQGEGVFTKAQMAALGASSSRATNKADVGSQAVFHINITGDISKQTKAEIYKMIPTIATGVNAHNKEKGVR